jgi:cardiolipin synthase
VTRRPPAWVPNAITLLRVALVPVMLWLAWPRPGRPIGYPVPATSALILIGLSDVVDGFLARRFALSSRAGVILDATADKLAQVAVIGFFTLVVPRLPVWFLALLLARDLIVGSGTLVFAKIRPNARLAHRVHGKGASLVLFLLMLALTTGVWGRPGSTLFWSSTFLVGLSTVAYVFEGVARVREPLAESRARAGDGQ